jgi:hypothetical protein
MICPVVHDGEVQLVLTLGEKITIVNMLNMIVITCVRFLKCAP